MGDEKQSQGSGKPNKFNQQNKHADERKASDKASEKNAPTQPNTEPATETAFTEPTKKP